MVSTYVTRRIQFGVCVFLQPPQPHERVSVRFGSPPPPVPQPTQKKEINRHRIIFCLHLMGIGVDDGLLLLSFIAGYGHLMMV